MRTRISVCMATHNGADYLPEQLRSIAEQLTDDDEIVVVDDNSTDQTLEVLASASLPRVRLIQSATNVGPVRAFETAIHAARGEFIFLADQDDVWLPGRVEAMLDALREHDLVVADAIVTDADLQPVQDSFFQVRHSGPGVWKNFKRSTYVGCCMAFRAPVARAALPIPRGVYMHDVWIGLIANALSRVTFLPQPALLYRRHARTATEVPAASKLLTTKIAVRRVLLGGHLLLRLGTLKLSQLRRSGPPNT